MSVAAEHITVVFVNKHSGKAITIVEDDIKQEPLTYGPSQEFVLINVGEGYFSIVNKESRRRLDVSRASHDDLAPIIPYQEEVGAKNQAFKLEDAGGGFVVIRAKHSNKVIDVPQASIDSGVKLIQYTHNGGSNQLFRVIAVPNHPASHHHPGHLAGNTDLPHLKPHESNTAAALEDANTVHKALTSGWFTDDNSVFGVLARRTQAQLADMRVQYETTLKRNLLDDIKSNTHGHFEDLSIALVMRPAEYDAYRIHKGVDKLLGASETQLIEILAHREVFEVKALNIEYTNAYGKSAQAALEQDLGGEIGLLLSLLADPNNERKHPADVDKQIEIDTQALYEASQGKTFGHHAEPFIRIFASSNREYLKKLYNSYANKHGKTLEAIISGWAIGGHVAKGLLAIITPPEEFYAVSLNNATKGVGTDNSAVIRILTSQRERYLPGIANYFLHTYKKTLKDEIQSETSGDFKHALVSLLDYYATAK